MRLGTVARVYLLAAMIALAILDTFPRRIALAQIPEAPGTFTNSSGGARIPQGPVDTGPVGEKMPRPQVNPRPAHVTRSMSWTGRGAGDAAHLCQCRHRRASAEHSRAQEVRGTARCWRFFRRAGRCGLAGEMDG